MKLLPILTLLLNFFELKVFIEQIYNSACLLEQQNFCCNFEI